MKLYLPMIFLCPLTSPPARGAWIEMVKHGLIRAGRVAHGRPPHGGRGLKYPVLYVADVVYESPPARGAWIEMRPAKGDRYGSVRRPPHGGRGLK